MQKVAFGIGPLTFITKQVISYLSNIKNNLIKKEKEMKIEVTDNITKEDEDIILKEIIKYNLERIEDKNPKDLGIFLYDEDDNKIAGLIGDTHANWFSIKFLWVKEQFRGNNIGSRLLQQAEETAKERGCKYSFLDTFGFQAPNFYKKHGYKEAFILENYPLSGKRHYFTKKL